MARAPIPRGSVFKAGIVFAVIHLIISCVVLSVVLWFAPLEDYSVKQLIANAYLFLGVPGILSAVLVLCSLFCQISFFCLFGLVLVFVEALGYIILFICYYFGWAELDKSLMIDDQNFGIPILVVNMFLTLFFTFAYSRIYRLLFPPAIQMEQPQNTTHIEA